MARMSTLNDLLDSIIERGARLVDWSPPQKAEARPVAKVAAEVAAELLSSKGEASTLALAAETLRLFEALDADEQDAFFTFLGGGFDPDPKAVVTAAVAYERQPEPQTLAALLELVEPPRQELLRRLNTAPNGTERLVRMREKLFGAMKRDPALARVDADFGHLLSSWFNRGFLVLRSIDWSTPANVLEKIIAYEAVHEIDSWEALRLRLEPSDRRCFAFFHPAMPDEPLIFVEVALTSGVATSIQEVLTPDREVIAAGEATTAVFYSISNCQKGLRGVSFGAFLIKQVAQDLARALPNLSNFVTLSPMPGFLSWVRAEAKADPAGLAASIAPWLADLDWPRDADRTAELEGPLMRLAARYLIEGKRGDGAPVDPVARFHLGNGAALAQINWLADRSAKGLARSAGVMVNYAYALDEIEANHEAYAAEGVVAASRSVRALLK